MAQVGNGYNIIIMDWSNGNEVGSVVLSQLLSSCWKVFVQGLLLICFPIRRHITGLKRKKSLKKSLVLRKKSEEVRCNSSYFWCCLASKCANAFVLTTFHHCSLESVPKADARLQHMRNPTIHH